jgi:hypothetical protein
MSSRLARMTRFCVQFFIVILQALLTVWVMYAPLVWIVRDGLGPDGHDSGWPLALVKFSAQWGLPALLLAAPL